jgi:7-cyano-7-deazaguanine synthase
MNALLLSGGLDSIAMAWWLRPEVTFTVDYGHISSPAEIQASAQVAAALALRHEVLTADVRSLGAGDLAGSDRHPLAPEPEWWPFRNQLLITVAGMRAIGIGVTSLLIGTVKSDGFHADGRTDFVSAIDALCRLQEGHLRIEAPAIGMSSVDLIRTSGIPRDVLAWAHSCHKGVMACGRCRGCNKHRSVMEEMGYDLY